MTAATNVSTAEADNNRTVFLISAASAALWVCLNVVLSVTNKWLFKFEGFHFPVLIIVTGLFVTFIGSGIFIFILKASKFPSKELLRENYILILITAATHGLATGLENISIDYISISLNQVIKATSPAFTMVLSHYLENRRYSLRMKLLMATLIVGASLTTFHNPSFSMIGFLTSLASCLLAVVKTMIMGRLLQRSKITPLSLTFLISLPAALSLVPVFFWMEWDLMLASTSQPNFQRDVIVMLVMNWVAFGYILIGMVVIHRTSAHYSMIIANFKVVVLVIVSTQLFNTLFTTLNLVGLLLSFIAFCGYNYCKIYDEQVIVEKLGDHQSNPKLSSQTPFSDEEEVGSESDHHQSSRNSSSGEVMIEMESLIRTPSTEDDDEDFQYTRDSISAGMHSPSDYISIHRSKGQTAYYNIHHIQRASAIDHND